jgi:hypothetical protein
MPRPILREARITAETMYNGRRMSVPATRPLINEAAITPKVPAAP